MRSRRRVGSIIERTTGQCRACSLHKQGNSVAGAEYDDIRTWSQQRVLCATNLDEFTEDYVDSGSDEDRTDYTPFCNQTNMSGRLVILAVARLSSPYLLILISTASWPRHTYVVPCCAFFPMCWMSRNLILYSRGCSGNIQNRGYSLPTEAPLKKPLFTKGVGRKLVDTKYSKLNVTKRMIPISEFAYERVWVVAA